jgi:hypothetical protein
VARTLHRNPQTRHLLKTVPTIARRTVNSLARQAARGRAVTPGTAVRTLARQAQRVLTHPGRRAHALRQHNRLERGFHRAYGPGMARPHWRYGRGRRWYGRYPRGYWRGRVPSGGAPGYAGAAPGYTASGHVVPGGGAPVTYQGGRIVTRPGAPPVRYGRIVGGRCTCPSTQYCRCCGQILR